MFGCFLMDFGLNVDNCLIDLLFIVYGFGQARWRVRRSAAHWIPKVSSKRVVVVAAAIVVVGHGTD